MQYQIDNFKVLASDQTDLKVLIKNQVNFEDSKNVIVASTMLVLGLGGYLVFDKVLSNNETEIKAKDLQLLSEIYHNLGHSIMLQGNNSKALKYLNRSKEIQLKINND